MSFPLGSFTDGLFSGAQNTVQLMGEVQKYQEDKLQFQRDEQKLNDAVKLNDANHPAAQPTQPSTALSGAQPSPNVEVPAPSPNTPVDPNLVPLSPAGSPPSTTTPTVQAPTPAPATTVPAPITPQAGGYDPATAATPAPAVPAAPAPAAPAKTSALGGTAYTSAGQTQTADASGGKSYTSDAPLVYLPPGQFSAQTRSQAQATQQRAPPSQVTALSGANFPTVGRA